MFSQHVSDPNSAGTNLRSAGYDDHAYVRELQLGKSEGRYTWANNT